MLHILCLMLGPLPVCCAKRTVATLFPLPPLPRLLPRVQFPALPPSPPCCYEPLVPPGESPAPTTALAPAPANCTVLGTGRYDEPLNLNDRRQEVDVLSPSHTSPTQRKRRRSQPSGQATVPEVLSPVELVVALTQGGQRLTSEQVASIIGASISATRVCLVKQREFAVVRRCANLPDGCGSERGTGRRKNALQLTESKR